MATVGFDFGTTNSLISMVVGHDIVSFYDEGLPIPSVVCYEGSKTIVGREARVRQSQAGLGVHGELVRSPKMHLGEERITVGGVQRNPVDIVHEVIAHVCRHAEESGLVEGLKIERAIATIPVNMDGARRALLREAYRMAGMGVVQFVHEPLAALYAYVRTSGDAEGAIRRFDRQLMLVFDWGGGTLDLTLCRLEDGLLVQLANDGTDDVGGDLFDALLRNQVESRVRAERNFGEKVAVYPDARTQLMHECERVKIELSRKSNANIFVPNFFKGIADESLDLTLSKEELEGIVSELLMKGIARIERLLQTKGFSTASVALCLATGGMVNMPAVRARLHELFGPQRVHISERSASLISEGAAWIAHDNARLHLAKNVELALARNSYVAILPAGLEMPIERESRADSFSLYCVDPADGHGRIQLVMPYRPGRNVLPNDERRSLHYMLLEVDSKAQPFRERLSLDVSIDDNLILTARARALNRNSLSEVKIHDLEFALATPGGNRGWLGAPDTKASNSGRSRSKGDIVMRSNIATREDKSLIPGEVLYPIEFGPGLYSVREMTDLQWKEHLYYCPCAYCKLPSNDPRCSCASKPSFPPPREATGLTETK